MDFAKTLATLALTLTTLGVAGCGGGGPEGTYKLDKAEVKKAMEAEIGKLPAADQGMAKLGLAMIDAIDMSIELQAGGKLKAHSTSPSFEPGKPGKTEDKDGTWKAEGDKLTLDTGDNKPLTCTKSGNKLSCTGSKKGDMSLVFVKG